MPGSVARAVLAVTGCLALGCSEAAQSPAGTDVDPSLVVKPGEPGAASSRMFFKAKLDPAGDYGARGMVMVEVVGGSMAVTVHANGLAPHQHTPQHIHLNPGCDPGGGILINLDAGLTVAGEAPGVGANYPVTDQGGVLKYHATRSLASMMAAINTQTGAGLSTEAELLAWLNLEERNAHIHVPVGPPFPAVNCGPLDQVN